MSRLVITIFIALILSLSALAQAQQWSKVGSTLPAGHIRNLYSVSPSELYATGEESLFRTTDAGLTWKKVVLPIPFTITCITPFSGKVLVGTKANGIYELSFNGDNSEWESKTDAIVNDPGEVLHNADESLSVSSIVYDNLSGNILADMYHNGHPGLGGSHSRIYFSSDKGQTWKKTQFDTHNKISSFEISPDRRTAVAATGNGIYTADISNINQQSTLNFRYITDLKLQKVVKTNNRLIGIPDYQKYIEKYYNDPNFRINDLYDIYKSLFVSYDGISWSTVILNHPHMEYGITDLYYSENTDLYLSTYYGPYVTDERQLSNNSVWRPVSSLSNINVYSSKIILNGSDIYITPEKGLLKITNGNAVQADKGLEINYIHNTYASNKYIFAVTENSFLRLPLDNTNAAWQNVNNMLSHYTYDWSNIEWFSEITNASITTNKNRHIFIATNNNIIKSVDEGDRWQFIANLEYPYQENIKSISAINTNLYAISRDLVFISENGGTSWKPEVDSNMGITDARNTGYPYANLSLKEILEASGEPYLIAEDFSGAAGGGHDVWTFPNDFHIYKYNALASRWIKFKSYGKKARVLSHVVKGDKVIFSLKDETGNNYLQSLDIKTASWDSKTYKSPLNGNDGIVKKMYDINGNTYIVTTKSKYIYISENGLDNWVQHEISDGTSVSSLSTTSSHLIVSLTGGGVKSFPLAHFFKPKVLVREVSNKKATSVLLSGNVSAVGGYKVAPQFEIFSDSEMKNSVGGVIKVNEITGTNQTVTAELNGLVGDTVYFYFLKGINSGGAVSESKGSFKTEKYLRIDDTDLNANATEAKSNFNQVENDVPVVLTLNNQLAGTQVKLFTRSLTKDNLDSTSLQSTTKKFEGKIPASKFDEVGVEYYFKITPPPGYFEPQARSFSSKPQRIAVQHQSGLQFPVELKYGKDKKSYNFISIPLEYENTTVMFKELLSEVLGDKVEHDVTRWRLLSYKEQKANGEAEWDEIFKLGETKVQPGKGYWLAIAEEVKGKKINLDGGKTVANYTVANYQNKPDGFSFDNVNYFTIKLEPGFNQIGNPFNLKVKWSDVLQESSIQGVNNSIGDLIVYDRGKEGQQYLIASDTLKPFNGGYVENKSSSVVELRIPIKRNKGLNGGRLAADDEKVLMPLSVRFTLESNKMINMLAEFGLHPEASLGVDRFDLTQPPSMGGFPLISFKGEGDLTRDVRPISIEGQDWEFTASEVDKGALAVISWPQIKSESGKQLWLHDLTSERKIDMLSVSSYTFSGNARFKVYYGTAQHIKELMLPRQNLLHVYPNPFSREITFGFTLTKMSGDQNVVLSVLDARGGRVSVIKEGRYQEGFHQVEWQGQHLPAGLYMVELKVNGKSGTKVYRQKVIRR